MAFRRTGFLTAMAMADRRVGAGGRARHNVEKFASLAREVGDEGLPQLLRRLDGLRQKEVREGEARPGVPDPEAGAVQVMSVHAAKGLEFPVVAVADLGRPPYEPPEAPVLRMDPAHGVVCRHRDPAGDWQEGAGYGWAAWLDKRMEAAEERRLLYVACTRAADHLILSGQPSYKETWLQQILDAWEIEADGPEEQVFPLGDYAVRVRRPAYTPPERSRRDSTWPDSLVEEGHGVPGEELTLTSMQPAIAPVDQAAPQPVAATHIAGPSEAAVVPRLSRPQRAGSAPGWVVGRLVHRGLARFAETGDAQEAELAAQARREGLHRPDLVEDAVRRARIMIRRLMGHELGAKVAAARRRHPELPVSAEIDGRLVHGTIDLLFQAADGAWWLVDWKTDYAPDLEAAKRLLDDPARHYRKQLAAYADAVTAGLGVAPRAVMVGLHPVVTVVELTPPR